MIFDLNRDALLQQKICNKYKDLLILLYFLDREGYFNMKISRDGVGEILFQIGMRMYK